MQPEEKPTIPQRLRACWRVLTGKPHTAWKRVEWTTGPFDNQPGYTLSVWLGMSDMMTVMEKDKNIGIFGFQAEHPGPRVTNYIPVSGFPGPDGTNSAAELVDPN